MRINIVCLLIVISVSLPACKSDSYGIDKAKYETVKYLHLSHTRTSANPNMVSEVEDLDVSKYDMLWLGGDLAMATSADERTMLHVDSILDLTNENTLWTLGNHDYSKLSLVQKFTDRPSFYAFHKNGISFLVLDTQMSKSIINGKQKELFDTVTDSLEGSSHLVLLHHKMIWMPENPELESQISAVSNAKFGDCGYCLNPNNFYTELYPKLVEIKNKGIEVLCIGGDIGNKTKEFDFVTQEGIRFLASGVSFEEDENQALIFTHHLKLNTLSWEFKSLKDL